MLETVSRKLTLWIHGLQQEGPQFEPVTAHQQNQSMMAIPSTDPKMECGENSTRPFTRKRPFTTPKRPAPPRTEEKCPNIALPTLLLPPYASLLTTIPP